jgi:GT2 family glycosyltransferase/tetratricopeptide (TPR) repeat protein
MTRIAVIFDHLLRSDTTGVYCLRALAELAQVDQFHPSQLAEIGRSGYDLYLFVDDGLDYLLPRDLRPQAYWAIDTHMDFERERSRAAGADFVFAAQKNGAEQLTKSLCRPVEWLPLACDPTIHARQEVALSFNLCFVGNLIGSERIRLLQLLQSEILGVHVGRHYFEDMAAVYSASRLAFNRSVVDDINMRVFEVLCSGSLLVTNDLSENGQEELFQNGKHLVTYNGDRELLDTVRFYLKNHSTREEIAAAGQKEVVEKHTYRHRMKRILEATKPRLQVTRADLSGPERTVQSTSERNARETMPLSAPADGHMTRGLSSIVMLTNNQLEYTKLCLDSVRNCTDEPYELIVVDNASSDGTVEYLRNLGNVRLIQNAENRGFPAAVNQGIAEARGQYIVLLNNDCIVTAGWLARLLRAVESAPDIGLVGPYSNCVSGEQQIQVNYQKLDEIDRFASEWAIAHEGQRREIDRLVAFCLLIKRSVIDHVGVLDERFGLGNFEDDDFCRRALAAGFKAVIAQDAFVHHFGSVTYRAMGVDYTLLMNRNRELFEEKWRTDSAQKQFLSQSLAPPPRFELKKCDKPGLRLQLARPRLSLCMIVRDSARTLGACLESIRPWVNEIIVVDTGSRDATIEIAELYGAKVFHFPWCDSFSAARNESLSHATGDWLFWMDSDDTIDAENGRKLRELVDGSHQPEVIAYVAQVHCPHEPDGPDYTAVDHVKLFRNLPELRFEGRIHEQILPAINRLGGSVAWTDLFVVHSGSDHSQDGQARKLARDLRLLALEDAERPNHPFTNFNLGMTYLELKRYDEAAQYLARTIAVAGPQESHVPKAFSLLIQALSELERRDEAWERSRAGLQRYPDDPELLFRAGVLAQHAGRNLEAERYYQTVLDGRFTPKFRSIDRGILGYKTRQNLACLYDEQGRHAEAEQLWRQIVVERPHYDVGWRGLVTNLLKQGKLTDARELVNSSGILSQLPSLVPQLQASIEESAGNMTSARRILEKAVADSPNDLELRDALCRHLFEHAEPEHAESALKGLIDHSPHNAAALYNLATVRLRQEKFESAVEAYQASLALRPDWPQAHAYLATCYERLGRKAEASAELAKLNGRSFAREQRSEASRAPHEKRPWFQSPEELADAIETCFEAAEREESKLTSDIMSVAGMTSRRIRHLLNRLGELPGCHYLEIGSFFGATLLAASFDNPGSFIAVDDFSEFNEPDPRPKFYANLSKFQDHCHVDFREEDCWKLPAELLPGSVNIFFYDGAHTPEAQRDALVRFADVFSDPFVLLIDDWNFDFVRAATLEAVQELGWTLHREWSRPTGYNGDPASWWNGFFAAVVAKKGSASRDTSRSSTRVLAFAP